MLGVSVVLMQAGATLTKMIRIQLLASISLTLPRMWLWLREVKCVCTILYTGMLVCYFWEPCLLLTFKPTGNGKWFAILKTHAEVRQLVDTAFQWPRVSL